MGHLYGDSTPFPHDTNFIEILRQTIDCGVQLMNAQHAVSTAVDRSGSVDQARKSERSRLDAMADALKLTMTAFMSSNSERMVRAASRILETARQVIDSEMKTLEGQVEGEISSTRQALERGREITFRAVEALLLRYDLPNTDVAIHLLADDSGYAGQALVESPFGVEAVFALQIPTAHEWGKPRRVADLTAGTELHLPQESGWLSRRMEMHVVKLDRLFVAEVAVGGDRSLLVLRKAPRSGTGYQLEVGDEQIVLRRLSEEGTPAAEPALELDGEDSVHALRLWNRVVDSTRDLAMRRQAMTSANFNGKPLREVNDPQAICARLIAQLAPIAKEIARRSGAAGELVLRRDVGQGRREEIYITKAELHEKVMTLPYTLRGIFDPFELSDGPRSPRAPAPSEPIYLDGDTDQEPTKSRNPAG